MPQDMGKQFENWKQKEVLETSVKDVCAVGRPVRCKPSRQMKKLWHDGGNCLKGAL